MKETYKPLLTPKMVLSYPHLAQPQLTDTGKKLYTAALIVTPAVLATEEGKRRMALLKDAAIAAATAKFGPKVTYGKGEIPVGDALGTALYSPFHTDAERKGYPAGSTYLNVRTAVAPGLVKPDMTRVAPDEVEALFYPGCLVYASLSVYAYDNKTRGVGFGLNNMQWVGHGDRIDARSAPEDEFTVQAEPDINSVL